MFLGQLALLVVERQGVFLLLLLLAADVFELFGEGSRGALMLS